MACKQIIVLPPEIPMIFGSPAHIQTFIGDMVAPTREVIAAHPLSTKYGVNVEYILHDFIYDGSLQRQKCAVALGPAVALGTV
jgi:hypothetical protein